MWEQQQQTTSFTDCLIVILIYNHNIVAKLCSPTNKHGKPELYLQTCINIAITILSEYNTIDFFPQKPRIYC